VLLFSNTTLIAEGTTAEPILFTSNANYSCIRGLEQHRYRSIYCNTIKFQYCVFEYGGLNTSNQKNGTIVIHDGGKVILIIANSENRSVYAAQLDDKSPFNVFTIITSTTSMILPFDNW